MRTHGSEPIELLPLAGHRVGGEPALMRLIDQQFLRTPFYGSRRMTVSLERSGETVNRKRVQRLMALMGLDAIFPKPRTTVAAPDARVYPYLLRDRVLTHVNEVWSSDITYVPMTTWLHVPDGGDRLVQPVRALVAAVEHAGGAVLPGSPRRGVVDGPARDLQHRPGFAVHGGITPAAWRRPGSR